MRACEHKHTHRPAPRTHPPSQVATSRYFEHTSIILFLNKRDLFAEKVATTPLKQPNPNPFAAGACERALGGARCRGRAVGACTCVCGTQPI